MAKDPAAKAAKGAAKAEAEAAEQARIEAEAKAARKAAKGKGKSKSTDDSDDEGSGGLVAVGRGGDLFKAKDWGEGALILFTGQRIDTNVTTEQGTEAEVPVGKVVVLDVANPTKPLGLFPNTRVFGRALLTALREAAETRQSTAGILGSQQFSKGKGWTLTDDAKATKAAKAYLASINPLD